MKSDKPVFQNPQLPGSSISWSGNQTGVLLIHGFTATTAEVRLLAEFFHSKGYTVAAPLLPGHGTTPQDLNTVKYKDWLECVESAYQKIKQRCNRLIVGGESMGAILSLYLAEQHPEIDGLLLYSPAIKVSNLKYAKFLKFFIPIMNKNNNDNDIPWQGYTVYPMKAAHEFNKLQHKIIRELKVISQPALILHGIYDQTIDRDSSQLIYERISSNLKTMEMMHHSGHVMLLDREINSIYKITMKFLKDADIL